MKGLEAFSAYMRLMGLPLPVAPSVAPTLEGNPFPTTSDAPAPIPEAEIERIRQRVQAIFADVRQRQWLRNWQPEDGEKTQ